MWFVNHLNPRKCQAIGVGRASLGMREAIRRDGEQDHSGTTHDSQRTQGDARDRNVHEKEVEYARVTFSDQAWAGPGPVVSEPRSWSWYLLKKVPALLQTLPYSINIKGIET